ncbi:hypothetical protein BXZ70DRAFT_1007469 [Cristinia sonorae]|uniref:Uncharacterized protein n=1 Tax=Cristinia sonorae TaxID=1940300 RepID=A0A8K0URG8_9AGAR|nr:hypothetical protein BXZ70DRAFT_1010764 [Cristinia sonorae]KAH8101068.1 hypothetical protein BXZ70DRAFT_1007469 [Cristinia sonorae]
MSHPPSSPIVHSVASMSSSQRPTPKGSQRVPLHHPRSARPQIASATEDVDFAQLLADFPDNQASGAAQIRTPTLVPSPAPSIAQSSAPSVAQAPATGPAQAAAPAHQPAPPLTAALSTTFLSTPVASYAADSSAGGATRTAGVHAPSGQLSERKSLGIPKSARMSTPAHAEAIPLPTAHAQDNSVLTDIASLEVTTAAQQTRWNAPSDIPLSKLLEVLHLESANHNARVSRRIDRLLEEPEWIPRHPSISALDDNNPDNGVPHEPLIFPRHLEDNDIVLDRLVRSGMIDMALLAVEKTFKSRKTKTDIIKNMMRALEEDEKDLNTICSMGRNNIMRLGSLNAATEPFLLHRSRRPL